MICKYTDSRQRCSRHQLSEGGLVLSEKIVDDDPPVSDTFRVHLKEAGFEEQLERLFAPGFSRVLVTAERRNQGTAGAETGHIGQTKVMQRGEITNRLV